jgi:hypothetical protein
VLVTPRVVVSGSNVSTYFCTFSFVLDRIEDDDEIEKDVSRADVSRTTANESCMIQ